MTRTTCRSCGSSQIKSILTFGSMYLSDFTQTPRLPKKFPLDLILCRTCYLLQTKDTVASELLYTERYGYRSGINTTMKKELQEIVAKAQEYVQLSKGDIVVDIGANDGTLLSFYHKEIIRIGVEPVKKLARMCMSFADYVIPDFFSKKSYETYMPGKKAKIITAISMFYDLDTPNAFVSDIFHLLQWSIFSKSITWIFFMLNYHQLMAAVLEHIFVIKIPEQLWILFLL